jgi:hypothetical protein
MGYRLDGPGSILQDFSLLHKVQVLGPTHCPIQWVAGDLSRRVKQSGREANHSVPRSRMMELYIHSPTYLHDMLLN